MPRCSTPVRRCFLHWSLLAIIAGAAGGCGGSGGGDNSAGGAVARYVRAISTGDVPGALACVEPEKRTKAEPVVRLGAELASSFIKPEGGLDSVIIVDATVRGDRARVEFKTRTKKGLERRNTTAAEKVRGVWYVAP